MHAYTFDRTTLMHTYSVQLAMDLKETKTQEKNQSHRKEYNERNFKKKSFIKIG